MGSARASSFIQNQLLVAGCSLLLTGLALFLQSMDRIFSVSGEELSKTTLQDPSRPLLARLLLDLLISYVLFRFTSYIMAGTKTFFATNSRDPSFLVHGLFQLFGCVEVEQSILGDDEYTAASVDFLRTFGHGC